MNLPELDEEDLRWWAALACEPDPTEVPPRFTPAQKALFAYWCAHVLWTVDQWERWLRKSYGVKSISRLTDQQAQEALARLQAKQGEAA